MKNIDPTGIVKNLFYRDHCSIIDGYYVKDLDRLNRELKDVIIIDNSSSAYMLHPECALPISSWTGEKDDDVLIKYLPLLIELSQIEDCRNALKLFVDFDQVRIAKGIDICQAIVDHQKESGIFIN